MPWFKIDDKAHSHPKFMRAGNAALGLWLRCGSYSAQHLTEGIVPGVIAQLYGTAPQAAKLVKTGLWHQHGHDCPRCPQPGDGDYVIHDFFEGGRNTTRAQYEANKQSAADRQAKRRARQNAGENADDSLPKTDRIEGETSANRGAKEPQFSGSAAGQSHLSQRDPVDGVTTTQAFYPSHASTSYGSTSASKQDRDTAPGAASDEPIPDWARPLQELMRAGGLGGLRWNFRGRWVLLQELINQKGIEAMADHAIRAAQFASRPVVYATYFLDGWKELSAQPPPGTAPPRLKAVSGGHTPGHTPFRNPENQDVYDEPLI